ncbi:MAG TPA: hypothetical protein QGH10_01880 [Armatimonadota bacterium]|nr:hypothetical protein [Armatimonadota bacterium]
MPKQDKPKKTKPRWVTGWIRGAALTVVILGGLLGGQIWNRNAAVNVALEYERACAANFASGESQPLPPSEFIVEAVVAGLSSGVVTVKAKATIAGGSLSTTRDVHLVREWLSWKVDVSESPRPGSPL